jgi:hypothetical protein
MDRLPRNSPDQPGWTRRRAADARQAALERAVLWLLKE